MLRAEKSGSSIKWKHPYWSSVQPHLSVPSPQKLPCPFTLGFLVLTTPGPINGMVVEFSVRLIGQLVDRQSRGLGSALSRLGLVSATRPTEDVD